MIPALEVSEPIVTGPEGLTVESCVSLDDVVRGKSGGVVLEMLAGPVVLDTPLLSWLYNDSLVSVPVGLAVFVLIP